MIFHTDAAVGVINFWWLSNIWNVADNIINTAFADMNAGTSVICAQQGSLLKEGWRFSNIGLMWHRLFKQLQTFLQALKV